MYAIKQSSNHNKPAYLHTCVNLYAAAVHMRQRYTFATRQRERRGHTTETLIQTHVQERRIPLPFTNIVRPVTDYDRDQLEKFSFSKLDTFDQCGLKFLLKYREGLRAPERSLALDLGSLCHLVLELKGKALSGGKPINYARLSDIMVNGIKDLPGINTLRKRYVATWYKKDAYRSLTYNDKMSIFKHVLHTEMTGDPTWHPIAFEQPFAFVYKNQCIIRGFIDRIDKNAKGQYRTVDYKTSRKPFPKSKLPTALQFAIYGMAIWTLYGTVPEESLYRFILINENQRALTKGWEKRAIKKIDKLLSAIKEADARGYKPKATPLCHWCDYCKTNPNAVSYPDLCPYHSLWLPTKKSFKTNRKYNPNWDRHIPGCIKDKKRILF